MTDRHRKHNLMINSFFPFADTSKVLQVKHESKLISSQCDCSHTSIECCFCKSQCAGVVNKVDRSNCNFSEISKLSEGNLNVSINTISCCRATRTCQVSNMFFEDSNYTNVDRCHFFDHAKYASPNLDPRNY